MPMSRSSIGSTPATIAVTGATGMIGGALVTRLRERGHTVRRLVRSSREMQPGDVAWDPMAASLDKRVLAGCDAIVHLAGAPIAQRWTSDRKRDIRESRVRGTSLVANGVAAMDVKPGVVLSGSAVGYYGDRGDESLDEQSTSGSDFLSRVAREWEGAAAPIANAGVRLVLLRTGIVLSAHGGALAKMLPPFKLGLGGPIGNGRQWMSWISLEDHLRAMEHALFSDALHGPVNLVAPNPSTNAEFTATLGRVLSRPAVVPVPRIALQLVFGEMANATILASQRALPRALVDSKFVFAHPMLEAALRASV
ncbi:MAG: NAD-dependent epimerase/dehydratase [Gemmatimonadetes bacterium]|nr:NAD-dependent epimerase/dehydratase [Gemmatimonadota bacterium]